MARAPLSCAGQGHVSAVLTVCPQCLCNSCFDGDTGRTGVGTTRAAYRSLTSFVAPSPKVTFGGAGAEHSGLWVSGPQLRPSHRNRGITGLSGHCLASPFCRWGSPSRHPSSRPWQGSVLSHQPREAGLLPGGPADIWGQVRLGGGAAVGTVGRRAAAWPLAVTSGTAAVVTSRTFLGTAECPLLGGEATTPG